MYRLRKRQVEFLLVSRNSNRDQLVLPAGRVEASETLPETAIRECLEEAGAKIRIHGPLIRFDHYTIRGVSKPTMVYLASSEAIIPSPEGREVVWARYSDLSEGMYDVPYAILEVLDYAAQCLHKDIVAA